MNIYKKIREFFKNRKINAKTLINIAIITIAEIIMLLWWNNWEFTPAIIVALIQFYLIVEKRDVWGKLSKKEREEVLLSNEELKNLIKGIYTLFETGKTTEEVLEKIKNSK